MFPLQTFAAPSPIWNFSSNDSTETFEWNDDTKDDALTVFETTDWSEFQDKLIYKETEILLQKQMYLQKYAIWKIRLNQFYKTKICS